MNVPITRRKADFLGAPAVDLTAAKVLRIDFESKHYVVQLPELENRVFAIPVPDGEEAQTAPADIARHFGEHARKFNR